MKENSYSGKFIVFEGIDGSGKSTQSRLLKNHVEKEGYIVTATDFPQYGKKSAGLVEEYLAGKYGQSRDVTPYQASIFYACDRFDASFKIRRWLREGKIIVSDRYIGSNVGHQGGKMKNKSEWKKYLNWLFELEYGLFNIPKPDITIILKSIPEKSQSLTGDEQKIKERKHLEGKSKDIHEKDLSHLADAERSYMDWAQEFPEKKCLIECYKDGELLSPEVIHEKVWEEVLKIL